ncbi:MAG: hypothetical protein E6R03_12700 [Hyphomicrobiaceae bacterium]|nr:MAG: hypothetical protein E6R03_12700 [Hyphomicrobiaceae bacterium]
MTTKTNKKATTREILAGCTLLGKCTLDDAVKAVDMCIDEDGNRIPGVVWKDVLDATEHGYNRMWLPVRYVQVMRQNPELLVDLRKYLAEREAAKKEAGEDYDPQLEMGYKVRELRGEPDTKQRSWGEISVLLNTPESTISRAYDRLGVRRLGQRMGRGGRFAAQRPDLYVGHMRKEGAVIPMGVAASSIPVEACLNYNKDGKAAKPRSAEGPKRTTSKPRKVAAAKAG